MAAQERATAAQIGFIRSLFRERDTDALTSVQVDWLETFELRRLNREQASRVITALQKLDRASEETKAKAQGGPHGVPNGRYAIQHGGTLKFFKVSSPTEGRWVGRTFVEVQASSEFYPIRNQAERQLILAHIADDIRGAMLRYGQEIGSCGHCGRTLTNEESRELGIGPICRGKMGW